MDFLMGSISASLAIFLSYKVISRAIWDSQVYPLKIKTYQSHKHQTLVDAGYSSKWMSDEEAPLLKTQATDFHDRQAIRILIVETKAYWIDRHILYTADVVNGDMDQNTAKPIDTMVLDKVQLDKIMFVVDKLTERYNGEDSDPGKQGF
jgi:hypothetical protein